jgi:hypothetical protein
MCSGERRAISRQLSAFRYIEFFAPDHCKGIGGGFRMTVESSSILVTAFLRAISVLSLADG